MMRIYVIHLIIYSNLIFPFLSVSVFSSLHSVSLSCSVEVLRPCEHAARLQRSDILEDCEQGANSCYTLQSVEKIMKKVRTVNMKTKLFQHFDTLSTHDVLQVKYCSRVSPH